MDTPVHLWVMLLFGFPLIQFNWNIVSMARKSRIEYAGARYHAINHAINRGNYRSWRFEGSGARKSFLSCLDDLNDEQIQRVVEAEASQMREPRRERTLREALCVINHEAEDLLSGPKGLEDRSRSIFNLKRVVRS